MSAIFEWQEKEKGWYLYVGEYPAGWEKKGLVSRTTKPKFAKRGDDFSETCSDIVPYGSSLPPIGNIVLESSPPPSACTRSNRRSTISKPKLSTLRLVMDAPPCSRTHSSKRKTSPPALSATTERRVCYP